MSDETPVTPEDTGKAKKLKTPAEPLTVTRLKNIRPHQKVTFYRGLHLNSDIASSRAVPEYAGILAQVAGVAHQLEREGRVKLLETPVEREDQQGRLVGLIEYAAVGLEWPPE